MSEHFINFISFLRLPPQGTNYDPHQQFSFCFFRVFSFFIVRQNLTLADILYFCSGWGKFSWNFWKGLTHLPFLIFSFQICFLLLMKFALITLHVNLFISLNFYAMEIDVLIFRRITGFLWDLLHRQQSVEEVGFAFPHIKIYV